MISKKRLHPDKHLGNVFLTTLECPHIIMKVTFHSNRLLSAVGKNFTLTPLMFTSFCCGLLLRVGRGSDPLGRAAELLFPSALCLLGMLNRLPLWRNLGRRRFRRYFV